MREIPEGMLIWDGFDDCVVGIGSRCGFDDVVCYDAEKMITTLEAQGLSYEDAVEHLEYNVLGSYIGPNTPIIIYSLGACL
jgi:hypothetical protein